LRDPGARMSYTLAQMNTGIRAFGYKVTSDLQKARQALEDQEPQGFVDFIVATFDTPDTRVAHGEREKEIIDRGAFRSFAQSGRAAPHFLDHGEAFMPGRGGFPDSRLRIGTSHAFEENMDGLLVRSRYNLVKPVAREALSDLLDDPEIVGWSFRWDTDGIVKERQDGEVHVTDFGGDGILETSQLSARWMSAQEDAHLVAARTAIGSHSTETVGGSWDAGAQERAYTPPYARFYAWREAGGDAEAKSTFKFPHHMASSGAANTTGCSAGIAVLNGGRGGADIGDDRQGVYNHLAKHIRDADREPPPLRSTEEAALVARVWDGDELVKAALGERMVDDEDFARDVMAAAQKALEPSPAEHLIQDELTFYERLFV
jgi:hypothetical protein